MKKFCILFILFLPLAAWAQKNAGEILYNETVQLKINVEGQDDEIAKMLPKSQSVPKSLIFNENASLYQNAKGASGNTEINHNNDEGAQFNFVIKQPENITYRHFENGMLVESREFMDRNFLIEEEAAPLKWKLSSETRQILGYNCQKAVLIDSTRVVEAWYTAQIPVATGPGEFADLPGMILDVKIGEDRTISATKVDLKAIADKEMTKPTKGKSVTRAEFKKIVAEKMKEMNMEGGPGGGGTMKVIIRN